MAKLLLCLYSVISTGAFPEYQDTFLCPSTPQWRGLLNLLNSSSIALDQDQNYQTIQDDGETLFHEHRKNLSQYLSGIFKSRSELDQIFECSIGISASYRVLSMLHLYSWMPPTRRTGQVSLRIMHVGMNWLTHAFVIKGKNSAQWVDENDWPITIQRMNDEETMIQNFIAGADETQRRKMEVESGRVPDFGYQGTPHGHPQSLPNISSDFRGNQVISIATVCDYPPGNMLPVYSMSNNEIYAKKHNYTLYNGKRTNINRPHAWAKIDLLLKLVRERVSDWIFWFDCDSYFMDISRTLDSILWKYAGVSPDKLRNDVHAIIQEDHAMLNTGVFFIKVSKFSEEMLADVYGGENSPWIKHPWWENAAFSHWFLGDIHERLEQLDDRTGAGLYKRPHEFQMHGDMEGIYKHGILVSPQHEFNSYHPITSRIYQHDTWTPGKFVLAFSGVFQGSSPTVIAHLFANYYRLFCELNEVWDQCVEIEDVDIVDLHTEG